MRVLNINVPVELLHRWVTWFAPDIQPFRVPPEVAAACGFEADPGRLTPELRDTFWLWGVSKSSVLVWLTRAEACRLPVEVRRSQPAPHHWPHALTERNVVWPRHSPSRADHIASVRSWGRVASMAPRTSGYCGNRSRNG